MSERLSIKLQRQDDLVYLRLAGVVDEDNALEDSTREVPQGALLALDTREVARINSCGVRDWVNWLAGLEAQGCRIVLVDASVHVVDQINMVHNFIGGGRIKSFFAPYYCEDCDRELLERLEVAEIADPASVRPRCPACGQPTELDHLPEQYFAFLEDRARVALDAETARRLAKIDQGLFRQLRELDGGARQAAAVATPPVTERTAQPRAAGSSASGPAGLGGSAASRGSASGIPGPTAGSASQPGSAPSSPFSSPWLAGQRPGSAPSVPGSAPAAPRSLSVAPPSPPPRPPVAPLPPLPPPPPPQPAQAALGGLSALREVTGPGDSLPAPPWQAGAGAPGSPWASPQALPPWGQAPWGPPAAPQQGASPPPPPLPAASPAPPPRGLPPAVTVSLVAGIVVVLALMSLLVFRSW